jgi:hypothetical protein
MAWHSMAWQSNARDSVISYNAANRIYALSPAFTLAPAPALAR